MKVLRRWDPILEAWEDGFVFYRVPWIQMNAETGEAELVHKWVDSMIPDNVDMSFDDRGGKPVDCWGEIWGTVQNVTATLVRSEVTQ